MAGLIWTQPALADLDAIADYIALDNPAAATHLVHTVFAAIERLETFPRSGRTPPELPEGVYREIIVPPCRVFYREDKEAVLILHVMRAERQLRTYLLDAERPG